MSDGRPTQRTSRTLPKQLTIFVLAGRVDLVDPHLVDCETKSKFVSSEVPRMERRQNLTQNQEDDVVAEASQAVQQRHLDDEPVCGERESVREVSRSVPSISRLREKVV